MRRWNSLPRVGNQLDHVETSILSRRLFRRGQRILVAVSGGLDSMVLLHLLGSLSAKHGWRLTVAHFNHQLRGRNSDADEALVRRSARRMGLSLVAERSNVRAYAGRNKLSLEMSARKLRHEFLSRAAKGLGISTVALAHHADDQLELFFLRLLRGSGSEGLAGMKWHNPSPVNPKLELVRPLLDLPKSALRAYAEDAHVRFREDASNASMDIQRNRIRHELLPLLRRHYQPALDKTVLRVMELLGAEAEFVTQAAEARFELAHRSGHDRKPSPAFDGLPLALQRRYLRLELMRLGVPPEFELVEQLRLHAGSPINLPGMDRWQVVRVPEGLLTLRPPEEAVPKPVSRLVELGLGEESRQTTMDRGCIKWRIQAKTGSERPRQHIGREFFDADRVGSPVFLRHWLPGDHFQPIGMARTVKLQDFFTNSKVPRRKRHQLIVATTARGEVFWVEGMRISERFKLTKSTIRRLQWGWRRL